MRQRFDPVRVWNAVAARWPRGAGRLALATALLVAGCGRDHTAVGRVVFVDG